MKVKIRRGFIEPPSFFFKKMKEPLAYFISALCSVECSRFQIYVESHPSNNNVHLATFLSPYTLCDWAMGNIDPSVYTGREKGCRKSLQRWASSIIELNTLFIDSGVEDPIQFVLDNDLVYAQVGAYGFEPNFESIKNCIGLDLRPKDI